MKFNFNHVFKIALLTGFTVATASCTTDEVTPATPNPGGETGDRDYTIALAVGSGRTSTTYVQAVNDFSTGSINFDGYGFEVPSSRTARIFASEDGESLFDLDYGGGRVYKFSIDGGEEYTQVSETNVEYAIGTTHPRWTKINEDNALLHNVVSEQIWDGEEFVETRATARIMSIDLEDLSLGTTGEFEIPEAAMDADGDYVFRIDAPIVVGDKIYYGMGKAGYDPENDARVSATYSSVQTLVVDYPSLTNPEIITTTVEGAKGATNAYRAPASHVDENGDIYQIITVPDNTYDTFILRIRNGDYDESYSLNLDELLGENTISNGWFYAGNGIGYVPYANSDLGGLGDPVWSVARVDLYNNTAVKLSLPENLWLQQYQSGVMIDGKFHMAIAPLGQPGKIYMFDPASTAADGFTTGATLQTGADAYYIGIY